MPYRLRDNVSSCQVNDHLVFLDLGEDRYFRLSTRMETALLACLHGDAHPETHVDELVRRGILTCDDRPGRQLSNPDIGPPLRSSMEQRSDMPRLGLPVVMEVVSIVCSMQLQLKTRRLVHVINALNAYRRRFSTGAVSTRGETSLLRAASLFRRARLYVPIETCCLLDSLSMLRFLARRRMSATLVLGVTDDPFSAHCWVQAGVWVLNDTIGNATAYTPIRTI